MEKEKKIRMMIIIISMINDQCKLIDSFFISNRIHSIEFKFDELVLFLGNTIFFSSIWVQIRSNCNEWISLHSLYSFTHIHPLLLSFSFFSIYSFCHSIEPREKKKKKFLDSVFHFSRFFFLFSILPHSISVSQSINIFL